MYGVNVKGLERKSWCGIDGTSHNFNFGPIFPFSVLQSKFFRIFIYIDYKFLYNYQNSWFVF